jgi:adenylosuccinate lyase
MRAFHEAGDFKALLLADTDVIQALPPAEIERAFDLDEQLKHVDEIFHRVFEGRQEVVGAGFNRPVGR